VVEDNRQQQGTRPLTDLGALLSDAGSGGSGDVGVDALRMTVRSLTPKPVHISKPDKARRHHRFRALDRFTSESESLVVLPLNHVHEGLGPWPS
jgi:hypothetical protein